MISFDLKIFDLIHQSAGHNRLIDFLMIFFADYSGYVLAAIAIFLIFTSFNFKEWTRKLFFVSLTLLLSAGVITRTIWFVFPRLRPFAKLGFEPLINRIPDPSFPSSHMAFYFGLSFAFYFLGYKRWSYIFMAVSAVMGFARVFCGVHWPSDILGGIAVAFLSAFVADKLLPKGKTTA